MTKRRNRFALPYVLNDMRRREGKRSITHPSRAEDVAADVSSLVPKACVP